MVEPLSSNFRVITTNILGVQIFRKCTVLSVSLFFHFSQQFCQTKVIVKANTEWFSLVRPNWICSFRPFQIHSKYLKETVIKRPLQLWKKLALALNVPMDICYKIFFSFAKHKDKRIKNNDEKNCSYETYLWKLAHGRKHYMLCSYRLVVYK